MDTKIKLKFINDPIYGFITIPSALIFDLIEHPYFQRLRRISQMGMSYLVYPGAHHTRFHHALGAMYLMQLAVQTLQSKGIKISEEEKEALNVAILLHDIGHGPFSHAVEHSIVNNINHEQLSLYFMEALNEKFNNKLALALSIFKNEYSRKFMHQLISSQLDMDRLDYLKRDSFYTGVSEGNINSQRLIAMLNVHNDELVVEEKGIYSVEKFLIARRFMYWQVYLHKTGIVAEQLLVGVMKRAKELTEQGNDLNASKPLAYFLKHRIGPGDLNPQTLEYFAQLDDYDVMQAMKTWAYHDDFVLSKLSGMLLSRDLLKVKVSAKPFQPKVLENKLTKAQKAYDISKDEATYLVFTNLLSNRAYDMDRDAINLLTDKGELVEVSDASDQLNLKALSRTVRKYYLCYPKPDN